jgi:hypothetical protein
MTCITVTKLALAAVLLLQTARVLGPLSGLLLGNPPPAVQLLLLKLSQQQAFGPVMQLMVQYQQLAEISTPATSTCSSSSTSSSRGLKAEHAPHQLLVVA